MLLKVSLPDWFLFCILHKNFFFLIVKSKKLSCRPVRTGQCTFEAVGIIYFKQVFKKQKIYIYFLFQEKPFKDTPYACSRIYFFSHHCFINLTDARHPGLLFGATPSRWSCKPKSKLLRTTPDDSKAQWIEPQLQQMTGSKRKKKKDKAISDCQGTKSTSCWWSSNSAVAAAKAIIQGMICDKTARKVDIVALSDKTGIWTG